MYWNKVFCKAEESILPLSQVLIPALGKKSFQPCQKTVEDIDHILITLFIYFFFFALSRLWTNINLED